MADYGGGGDIRQLYGVILRDKAKTADKETLMAYRIVASAACRSFAASSLAPCIRSLADLEKAIQAHW